MADNRPIIANLDFQDVKDDMIAYFRERPEFADYEFTGSSLNLLMDILAYNTHYNALAANFVGNEMFLDSAVMRTNVVSIAKQLNYLPRSARASKTTLTINIPRVDDELIAVIPAGTLLASSSGNTTFNFYTIRDYTVQFETGTNQKTQEIEAYEGTLITQRFVGGTGGFQSFDLTNARADIETLVVAVNGTRYVQITPESQGVTEVSGNSNVYFVEETRNLNHRIVFGNNVIGREIDRGDEILATYLVTNGAAANGVRNFALTVPGRPSATIVDGSITTSVGGGDIESIREIKENAPRWFQSQYRAVTENDYAAFLRQNYADIQSISVYGGEKVGQPGKVFIAIKPKSADKLPDTAKNALENEVLTGSNVVSIRPEIVDPFIIDIVPKTNLIYDEALLAVSRETLEARVYALFDQFNSTFIGEFLENFRVSRLASEIQALDNSIVSSNTRISIRVSVEVGEDGILSTYNFSVNNRIFHPEEGYKNSSGGVLSSNYFNRDGRENLSAFDDDGYGNMRLFDLINGQKVYINERAGTIDYSNGTINITQEFRPNEGTLNFTLVPDSFDIIAENDTILRIATDDASVTAIERADTATQRAFNNSRSA